MIKWFKNCQTAESIKERYKNLVKQYHPDVSSYDSTAEMQEINAEFEEVFNKYKNIHESAEGNTYESTEQQTTETPEEFMEIINKLINCDGLTINIIGRWIWLEGNSYPYKDTIKTLGFKWASNKKAWYWHSAEEKSYNRKKLSLDDIKNMYGCTAFQTNSRMAIA